MKTGSLKTYKTMVSIACITSQALVCWKEEFCNSVEGMWWKLTSPKNYINMTIIKINIFMGIKCRKWNGIGFSFGGPDQKVI